MIKFLACIPLLVGSWLITAWFWMLIIGIIHADWIPALPTIGYPVALAIAGVHMLGIAARAAIGGVLKTVGT